MPTAQHRQDSALLIVRLAFTGDAYCKHASTCCAKFQTFELDGMEMIEVRTTAHASPKARHDVQPIARAEYL